VKNFVFNFQIIADYFILLSGISLRHSMVRLHCACHPGAHLLTAIRIQVDISLEVERIEEGVNELRCFSRYPTTVFHHPVEPTMTTFHTIRNQRQLVAAHDPCFMCSVTIPLRDMEK